MSALIKNVLFIGLLALVALGVYYVATQVDFFSAASTRMSDVEQRTAEIERTVIADLARLDRIKLDSSILTSEAFLSLENLSQPLPRPALSRTNPFSPTR